MRAAALCAGYGGIEMGLTIAGVDHQLAWFSEIDDAPASVMSHHNPQAPNLGDLTQIVEPPEVDLITAGFPCQPFSNAGQRKGTEDDRWLIDDVCRIARAAGAGWLILENVAGLLTANDGDAMARVCAAMAREGFSRWEWGTVRASDVGACHQRKRWFCVARNAESGEWHEQSTAGPGQHWKPAGQARGSDSEPVTLPTPTASWWSGSYAYSKSHVTLADATVRGLVDFTQYTRAIERHELALGREAPEPAVDGRLSPVFVEWMMMLKEGHVTDVPGLTRSQMLKILGNGVVPLQAAAAINMLVAT